MNNTDILTSDKRISALIDGGKIDRVPVIPHIESFAGKVCNMSAMEFYLNPIKAYEAQVRCKELFQHDGGIEYNIVNGFVADFAGGILEFQEKPVSAYPKIISRAVSCEKDIEKLKMPNVFNSFTGKKYLEFNKLLIDKGKTISIFAGSPAMMAINIVDMRLLMRWMVKKPEYVHRIMRFATDYILLMGREYVDKFGSKNIEAGMALPIESNNIMSPKMFEKFALPYIVEVFRNFDEMGIEISSIHLCGDHRRNIGYWKSDIGLKPRTLITVGAEMNLKSLSKEMGEDFIIGGNLKNLTLQTGTPLDVYIEAKEIIESMKYFKGGFVLTPDCTLSYSTPKENLNAMIEAARNIGKY